MKFHGNPSSGTRVVPCEGKDRHDEDTVLFRHFGNIFQINQFLRTYLCTTGGNL